ncbi:MAG: polysaccharide deacetylase family protein [Bacteroidales bacterium]|nr:polysaccharide deacetylase family protein [Bacteroidales bacterium]
MIRIYVPKLSERTRYIFHYVFDERLGLSYSLTDDLHDFKAYPLSEKMVYAPQNINEGLYIQALPLLCETHISEQALYLSWIKDIPLCFQTDNPSSTIPFDIFAACFYFLSRYEEYLPNETDEHDRYKAENSFAFQHNLLQKALVDRWVNYFSHIIKQHFPDEKMKKNEFRFIPTYDIDLAFLYKNKGLCLTLAGMGKQLIKREWKAIKNRLDSIFGKTPDPYDTFDYLEKLHQQYNLQTLFFILFASRSRYDKNNFINNKKFIALIQRLEQHATIGIHASYASSFSHVELLQKEIRQLQAVVKNPIVSNRQHYIRLRLPETYDMLLKNNIKDDYSMGYVNHIGFRAGTCFPFYFFNLKDNKATSLRVHPFLFMENALLNACDTSVEALWEKVKPCIEEVKKYQGEMITLFHNASFGTESNVDFKTFYERIINNILE